MIGSFLPMFIGLDSRSQNIRTRPSLRTTVRIDKSTTIKIIREVQIPITIETEITKRIVKTEATKRTVKIVGVEILITIQKEITEDIHNRRIF